MQSLESGRKRFAKKKIALVFGLVTLVLVLGVSIGSARILSKIAARWLQQIGLQEFSFAAVSPGMHELQLRSLHFRYQAGGKPIAGIFKEVTLSYGVLRRNGDMRNLMASDGTVTLGEDQSGHDGPISIATIFDTIRTLPIDEITLRNTRIFLGTDQEPMMLDIAVKRSPELNADFQIRYKTSLIKASITLLDSSDFRSNGKWSRGSSEEVYWNIQGASTNDNRVLIKLGGNIKYQPISANKPSSPAIEIQSIEALQFKPDAQGWKLERGSVSISSGVFKLEGGILAGSLSIPNAPKEQVHARLSVTDAPAKIAGVAVSGLNLKVSLGYVGGELTTPTVLISAKRVDAPIPIDEVSSELHLEHGKNIVIRRISANLLGGSVNVSQAELILGNDPWAIPVELHAIEMKKLLELYPGESIIGTGSLDAKFTLKNEKSGFRVDHGDLAARPPGGVIKYRATELGEKSQQSLAFALEALKDFHYTELIASCDFTPDGELKLKTMLRGNNPGWQKGRPIDLNLDITENLYQLLRTIRLIKDPESTLRG